MPELPEVEAARRAVEEHCVGKKIKRSIVADDAKVIDGVSPSDFQASLVGKTIVAARRKGKNMWLELDSPPFPSFQFGMAGAIYIKGVAVTKYRREVSRTTNSIVEYIMIRSAVNDTDEWPSKYSKVFVELDDGLELSFTDKRRFAKVRLLKDPISVPPISELGPDALLEPMQLDEFIDSLRKKKIAIKALLLDQVSYIAGIGNWIADEVLYQAKIHPLQIAASLSKDSCESLHTCIKEVIDKALEFGADSSQFPSNWIFHSREKKPGKAFVDGREIEFITAGGRTSAFVPELQKLSGTASGKAPSKSRKQTKKKGDDNEESGSSGEDTERAKLKKKSQKTGRGAANPTARKKSKGSDSDSDEGGQVKTTVKATKAKQTKVVEGTSKKRGITSNTTTQREKKARK